jgi:hypothetical protein
MSARKESRDLMETESADNQSHELELGRSLVHRLRSLGIRIEVPDRNTVIFRDVPVNREFFSKERTNLLIKRPHPGRPFLACIDDDLEYSGKDPGISRHIASSLTREGWRILPFEPRACLDLEATVESALSALGSDGSEPALRAAPAKHDREDGGLLRNVGISITENIIEGNAGPTVGRSEEITTAASCVCRWGEARLAVLSGEPGVGKTNLLAGIGRKLHEHKPDLELVSVDIGRLFAGTFLDAERENLLQTVLDEAKESEKTVLALEHMEILPLGTRRPVEHVIAEALDHGLGLLGTVLSDHLPFLRRPVLEHRMLVIELDEPSEEETLEILTALRGAIAEHHRVTIDDVCLRLCVVSSRDLPGCFPAKAIRLLDHAASRAALAGSSCVGADDVRTAL